MDGAAPGAKDATKAARLGLEYNGQSERKFGQSQAFFDRKRALQKVIEATVRYLSSHPAIGCGVEATVHNAVLCFRLRVQSSCTSSLPSRAVT